MGQPVAPEREVLRRLIRRVAQGQQAERLDPIDRPKLLHRTATRIEAPGQQNAEIERAAAPDEAASQVRGHDPRHDRREVRAPLRGGRPLRPARIGAPGHPDPAIAPGLGGEPFDRVEAIGSLVAERFIGPVRIESTANVLDRHRVAGIGQRPTLLDEPRQGVVVGRPTQDEREWARAVGEIEIGRELDPVAHRHAHVRPQTKSPSHAHGVAV